jgi:hypothetical protein
MSIPYTVKKKQAIFSVACFFVPPWREQVAASAAA